jgi:hypothetical protein
VTLGELLADSAIDLAGCSVETGGDGGRTWSRNKRPFAGLSADGRSAEFLLDPAVADAAVRTPDVTHSTRGRGWVTFTPSELDDHAADRAVAWFASAYRRTGPLD